MSNIIDITSQRFGRLTVVIQDEPSAATPSGPAAATAGMKRSCKRRTYGRDRQHRAAACARRATSTAGGRKSGPNRANLTAASKIAADLKWLRPLSLA